MFVGPKALRCASRGSAAPYVRWQQHTRARIRALSSCCIQYEAHPHVPRNLQVYVFCIHRIQIFKIIESGIYIPPAKPTEVNRPGGIMTKQKRKDHSSVFIQVVAIVRSFRNLGLFCFFRWVFPKRGGGGTLFGVPFKGDLFPWGHQGGAPILGRDGLEARNPVLRTLRCLMWRPGLLGRS